MSTAPSKKDMSYQGFVLAVATRESSNNYKCKNKYGFLGRFQFGMARLCDLGLTERVPGKRGVSNTAFRWKPGFSEEIFLNTPSLQDMIFDKHIAQHRADFLKKYKKHLGKTVQGVKVTLSGALAVYHLLGEGGFSAFIDGTNKADALGTSASDYLKLFAGYDIPEHFEKLAAISVVTSDVA